MRVEIVNWIMISLFVGFMVCYLADPANMELVCDFIYNTLYWRN